MNRQRVKETIDLGSSSICIMTTCMNQFQRNDLEQALDTEIEEFKRAFAQFSKKIIAYYRS